MENLDKLKDCLENRAPILYVGAGFSYNCKNYKEESVKLGKELCQLLYDYFWNSEKYDDEKLKTYKTDAKKYVDDCKLKELCQLLRVLGKHEERDAIIKDCFLGCYIENNDSRNFITCYPWTKIFTVNVDDLIENIYRQQGKNLNVWNRDNDDKKHDTKHPTLIKLHGCVNNSANGFVFDNEEYSIFQASNDYILNEFGDAFSKNDIIFIGTEFQEDDLKYIINTFIRMGYNAKNKYYFVSPKINDTLTKIEIDNSINMFHIEMTANEFFDFLNQEIVLQNDAYNRLIEFGLIDVHKCYTNIKSEYNSELYSGLNITYSDLKYNWDISFAPHDINEWAMNNTNNKIIAIYGSEYVGKTCVAKRILYDFFSMGFNCYEFKLNSNEKIDLFLECISESPKNDIAVLFEEASYLYELLVQRIVINNPTNKRIIIITTDVINNHKRKCHSLNKNENCKTIYVSEKINFEKANTIYEKLKDKFSLSKLQDISDKKEDIISFMVKNNDLIDVLYYSSCGRGFNDYINTNIISDIKDNKLKCKQISILLLLTKIGIIYIPSSLFEKATLQIDNNYCRHNFENELKKIIQIENNYYHLRYSRFLSNSFSDALTNEEKSSILKALAKFVSGRFNEGEYNELSTILYKILNIKVLGQLFNYSEIKLFYLSLENNCKQYSYYWVQRGLCAQKQIPNDYEQADRFLRQARSIRPNSYQVSHAIAKNQIERGLYSIKDGESGETTFFDGLNQIKELLDNKGYSKAFGYSLHAYIDSLIRYHDISNSVMTIDECRTINDYVSELNSSEIDYRLSNILFILKKYLYNNNLSKEVPNVSYVYWECKEANDDEEFVENDWCL